MKTIKLRKIFYGIIGMVFLFAAVSCGSSRKATYSANARHPATKRENRSVLQKYGDILQTNLDPASAPLYEYLDKWMGAPYRYGGSTRQGTDCSGLVMNVYRDLYNIEVPHSSEKQYDACKHINGKNLKEGELVFFRINKEKTVSHVGIYLANNKFIHATTKRGVMIDDLSEPYYAKTYVGAGRFK